MNKLHALKFGIAAGLLGGVCFAWTTAASLLKVPGFLPFAKLLEQGYSYYGYSITWAGVVVGGIWGFVEGFVWGGALALMYNKLLKMK